MKGKIKISREGKTVIEYTYQDCQYSYGDLVTEDVKLHPNSEERLSFKDINKEVEFNIVNNVSKLMVGDMVPDKLAYITNVTNSNLDNFHDYLPGFISQFKEELSDDDWSASGFLEWLQLNKYKIVR